MFHQAGPGRYEAVVEAAEVGSHIVSMRYDAPSGIEGGRRSGTMRAAIIHRAGEEFRSPTPNTALLWDVVRQTGGRIYQLDASGADLWVREHLRMPEISRSVWIVVLLAGIAVFLVDVALRRVAVDLAAIRAWAVRGVRVVSRGRRAAAPASLSSLANAKARAGEAMRERPGASRQHGRAETGAAPARYDVRLHVRPDAPSKPLEIQKPPAGEQPAGCPTPNRTHRGCHGQVEDMPVLERSSDTLTA